MKLLSYIRSVATKFLHRSRIADEMEEELRSHIALRADDLERSGLSRAQAERQARIEFGARERVKEECNEALGANFISIFANDARYSLRVLRKSPGFTLVAVLTLALAIGANAVVFAVLNALIIRPLNLPQSESLYGIEDRGGSGFQSYPDYLDLRDRNRSFDELAAFNITDVAIDTGKDPSRVWMYEITGNYFDAMRVQPYLGRMFHSSDEHGANSAPYVVLSYGYWHSHFQDDPNVVGRIVRLNKQPFTIVGVAPADFHGTLLFFAPDVFAPLVNHAQFGGDDELNQRAKRGIFEVLGHLKPGVTREQATADLSSVGLYLEKAYPKENGKKDFILVRPSLYGNFLGGPIRAFVAGLMLLAGLILLAACANLGSLFAARASDRSREVALRLALGSSRSRVLRQLLTEATLIALVGGAVGLLGSVALLHRLSTWNPFPRFPIHVPVDPDARVYAVALVLALISGILFGIVPVRQVLRANPYEVVKAGATTVTGRRISVRDFLLAAQIALCAVLVTSSLVALRGLVRSLNSNFGFDAQNAVVAQVALSMAGYDGNSAPAMQRRMIDALSGVRSVKSVGLIDELPLSMGGPRTNIYSDTTTDLRPANAVAKPFVYMISPDYFSAAGTALLSGRAFSWHDDKDAPRVAVINQDFARQVFGSVPGAMGRYYKTRDGARVQVVGVVEDGKYLNLAESQQPAMFLPMLQSPTTQTWLVVRSGDDPQQVGAAIRSKLRDLDQGLPVEIRPWRTNLDGVLFPSRMATLSLGVLGMMGAMLSITGIFGMAAYSVSRRLKELGIRMALGAQRGEVLRAALGRAVKLLAFGSVAGLILGLLATRVLAFIVYQATPRDPVVLAGVVLAMSLLGVLATWIPAQRALRLDPLLLLREE